MGQLSRIFRNVAGGGLTFWCPGCREAHTVWVGEGPGPRWGWNGDVERPVFTPSVLVTGRSFTAAGEAAFEAWHARGCPKPAPEFESADTRCHTFVGCNGAQPGQVIFLGDCTHELAGQIVDIPPMPEMRTIDAEPSQGA
jgi:hypothetical protein